MVVRCVLAHPPRPCKPAADASAAAASTEDTSGLVLLLGILQSAYESAGRHADKQPTDSADQWLFQQRCVFGTLLKHFQLHARCSSNWLAALHERVTSLVPPSYRRLHPFAAPPVAAARHLELKAFRQRGLISCCALMVAYQQLVVSTIQSLVGYGIPSDDALDVAARYGPIVEVGAGTGYWTAMLRERRVDVVAYDLQPPTHNASNPFFGQAMYAEVRRGDAAALFQKPELAPLLRGRSLLVVWPNNADWLDNPHVAPPSCPRTPPWDAACLEAFLAAGGTTVLYAGEREAVVQRQITLAGAAPDCGNSSSRRFQQLLAERFELVEQVDLPSWWVQADDLTVWRRRS